MWQVAIKGLERRLRRTALAVVGVGLVVALFITVHAISESFFNSFFSHMYNTPVDVWVSPATSVPGAGGSAIDPTVIDVVGKTAGVAEAEESFLAPGRGVFEGVKSEVSIVGYEPSGAYAGLSLIEGDLPSADPGAAEVVLDASARALWPGVGVGDTLTVSGAAMRVVGVTSGHKMVAAPVVFMPRDNALAALGWPPGEASTVLVRVEPGTSPDAMRDALAAALGEGVRVYTTDAVIQDWSDQFSYIRSVLSGISVLALLIGALLMTLIVYISVVERTRELGIMKALGATNRAVRALVLAEAVSVASLGFVVGAVLAVALTLAIPAVMPIEPELPPTLFAAAAAVTIVMAALGSLVGMRRAVKVDPIEAVRAV